MTSSDERDEICHQPGDDIKKAPKQISPSKKVLTAATEKKKNLQYGKICDSKKNNMQNPPHEGMKISFDPLLHSTKNDMLPKMKQVRVERKDQRKQHYRKKRFIN